MNVVDTEFVTPISKCGLGPAGLFADGTVVGVDHDAVELPDEFGDEFLGLDGFLSERVVTLPASPSSGVVQFLTPDALDHRGTLVGLVDLDAVRFGDGPIGFVREDAYVSGGVIGAANPAVVVLEEGLIDVLAREVGRGGLSEARRRRLRGEVCDGALTSLVERLSEHVAGDTFGLRELRPEIVITPAGMAFEPVSDVRDGADDSRRPAAVLSVLDGDLEPELAVSDVVDLELVEFRRPRAEVPAEGDQRFVTCVVAGVDHRLHVLVPVEHLRGVGRGIVSRGVTSRDPFKGLGRVGHTEGMASKRSEGLPVSSVGLLVVVAPVDPAEDLLGCLLVLEGVGEAADLAGDLDATHEDVAVLARGDFAAAEEFHPSVGVEDGLGVIVGEPVALLAPFDVTADRRLWLVRHNHLVYYWPCKPQVRSPPRPLDIWLTWPKHADSGGSIQPHVANTDSRGVAA